MRGAAQEAVVEGHESSAACCQEETIRRSHGTYDMDASCSDMHHEQRAVVS